MKQTRTVLPIAALLLAVSAYGISKNIDVNVGNAQADATGVMNVSVTCSQKAQEAWVPSIRFNMSIGAATNGSGNSISAASTLINAIEGDSPDPVTATLNAPGASFGFATLTTDMPTYKLTGVGCQQSAKMDVSAYGDGVDDANFDVAIDNYSADRGMFSMTKKVDHLTTAQPLKLVGFGGTTAVEVQDGTDNAATPDGQIVVSGVKAGTLMAQVNLVGANGNGEENINLLMQPY